MIHELGPGQALLTRAVCAAEELACMPWPRMRHWQLTQVGAIFWAAHSMLSKTWTAPPAARTSNAIS